jgi:hypothetical protein
MGFNPNPKLIKVSDVDASIPLPVHQADRCRQMFFKVCDFPRAVDNRSGTA